MMILQVLERPVLQVVANRPADQARKREIVNVGQNAERLMQCARKPDPNELFLTAFSTASFVIQMLSYFKTQHKKFCG